MIITESEKDFMRSHSMGCGYCGEFEKRGGCLGDPIYYECPVCGSTYIPEQECNEEILSFEGDSVSPFIRVSDKELIEELACRGYKVEKLPKGHWKL